MSIQTLKPERQEAPAGHEPRRVPLIEPSGMVSIDPWWGTIQPQVLHPGIRTVGELEVIEHIDAGGRLIDTRQDHYVDETGTLPGSIAIPWEEITSHAYLFLADQPIVLFCNGPQCAATPRAVEKLLDAGVRPEAMLYYRGGLQDWMALGLPTGPPQRQVTGA